MQKLLILLAVTLLSACSSNDDDSGSPNMDNYPGSNNSSSSSSSTSSSSGAGGESESPAEEDPMPALSLSGPHAAATGEQLHFEFLAARENAEEADALLVASDDSLALDLVLGFLGEFSSDEIEVGELAPERALLIVTPSEVSLRVERSGDYREYALSCVPQQCESVDFDLTERSLTFDDVMLSEASQEQDPNNPSLILNGTLQWDQEDAVIRGAPINNEGTPMAIPEGAEAATLNDLQGVWDGSTSLLNTTDELYHVFRDDQHIEYDYRGDAVDQEGNCYLVSTYTVEELGDGVFRFTGAGGTVEETTIFMQEESLRAGAFTLRPTDYTEGDFLPECE